MQPSATQRLRRRSRIAPVSEHHNRPSHNDFADFVGWEHAIIAIQDRDIVSQ